MSLRLEAAGMAENSGALAKGIAEGILNTSRSCSCFTSRHPSKTFEHMGFTVSLNVYDVAKSKKSNKLVVRINDMTQVLGFGGMFHGGVCVDDVEWSYGFSETGSGVYSVEPQKNPMYRFRESVSLGVTPLSKQQVREVLLRLRREWIGCQYDLLAHNCCHFCEVFTRELSCKTPPGWLNRFAQSAEVARSLGSRSVGLLRTSLAKMLPITQLKLDRSPACSSAPSTSDPVRSQSVGFASSTQGCSADALMFHTLSSGFSRRGSASTAAADGDDDGMFTRVGLCSRIGEASPVADKPAGMFARPGLRHAYTDHVLEGSGASGPNSPAPPDRSLENIFGRPWSMMLEEEDYLRGLSETVEDCVVPTGRCSESGSPAQDCAPCAPFRRESHRTLSGRHKGSVGRLGALSPPRRSPSGVLPSSFSVSRSASRRLSDEGAASPRSPWPGGPGMGASCGQHISAGLRLGGLTLPSQGSVQPICMAASCRDSDSCMHMLLHDGSLFSQSADQGPVASLAAAGSTAAELAGL